MEFSGDTVESINVTFSEQIESIDGKLSDLQSIVQQAQSMATSFPSTALQAEKGEQAQNTVLDMYTSGLNAAKTMLTNNDDNEVTITQSGIICKRMDDEGSYGEKQLRITGNMMAFTKNNWKSVGMAVGETTFKDPTKPEGKNEVKAYGVIADAIVGKLVASERMYIGNTSGNVLITGDGIKINKGTITWGANNVNAPEMGNINGLSEFKNKVNTALTGSATTEIGSDYVISPKIGGGYLHIANGNYSVEIDPNHKAGNDKTKDGYLFCIRNKNKAENDVIMGVTKDGKGYFSGEIHAKSGEFIGDIKSGSTITCGDNFVVTENGQVTAKDINITGGCIEIKNDNEHLPQISIFSSKGAKVDISPSEIYTYNSNGDYMQLTGESIQGWHQNVSGGMQIGSYSLNALDCCCYGNGYSFSDVYNRLSNKLSTDGKIKNISWVDIDGLSYLKIVVGNTGIFFRPSGYDLDTVG